MKVITSIRGGGKTTAITQLFFKSLHDGEDAILVVPNIASVRLALREAEFRFGDGDEHMTDYRNTLRRHILTFDEVLGHQTKGRHARLFYDDIDRMLGQFGEPVALTVTGQVVDIPLSDKEVTP